MLQDLTFWTLALSSVDARQATLKSRRAKMSAIPFTSTLMAICAGFELPSKHVLHTVGPIYSSSKAAQHEEKLASCYKTTLILAADNKLKTVALCGVSTGIYGFPLEKATHIACETTRQVLDERGDEVTPLWRIEDGQR